MRVHRHTGRLRERVAESRPHGCLKPLLWGILGGFPLASHYDSPGSQSLFGIFQGPPMCAHIS